MKNDSNESVKLIKDFISSNKECKENLEGLGRVFCEGGRIDWNLLYDKADYYRINAPLYPYQKKRYWYEYDGRRKFEYKFEDYCCKMLDNKMFPDDLKMQLEKFTNELNKYNSANSEDSISDLITLKGRTDDNYTDSERCIARKCYETFGYSEIDINDGFEMYNSDSLQMTTLYGKLRSEYNINLTDLYKYDSIRKLAEKIESNKMDIYKTKEKILEIYNKGIMESRDYYTDSRLMYAERIQKLNVIDFKVKKCYNNVMVTGVTGYLGIYILRELLENTEVKVSLIIRRMDNVSAEERLRGKIGKYFGSEFFDKYMERINVYEGDMFDTGFGLGETYSCLKEEVDCIVHCAANTSHFGEYSEFYEANVSMTENIIMFAEEGRKKDIHHISTYAVAQFNGAGNGMFVTEFDDVNTDHIDDVELFYPKTKIIAEKLINAARERGINANIYRVDDILFEYERGIMQENIDNSAVSLVMRSFLELGIIPDVIGLSYEFTFVDCAARSIVKLMSLSAYKCDNFHIGNPNTTELKDCLSDSRNIIHSELVSLSDFLDKGIEFFESSSSKFSIFNDILIHCFDGGNIQEDYRASEVGDDFTNSILEKMNFHWPELTPKVFNKYLSHCISVGFIKES